MIGLKNNEVLLTEYDNNWEIIAKEQIIVLNEILKDVVVDIQHIGSTSVKGLKAKPIIDIQVGLSNLDDVLRYKDKLEEAGLHFIESNRPKEERLCVLENKEGLTSFIVHFVIYKSSVWNNSILFRDYLNEYEDLRNLYLSKKEEFAFKYKNDRKSYTKSKKEIIKQILKLGKSRKE